jgi:hypothetical protein
VRASIVVKGRTVEAEQLWYDKTRWASWVDGFGHIAKLDDHWPQTGARLLWDSRGGWGGVLRGRVSETVTRYEARVGQLIDIEEARLHGVKRVIFEPGPEETRITLELDVEPKERLAPLRRAWLRRELGESLRRSLVRFSHELAAERQFGRSR